MNKTAKRIIGLAVVLILWFFYLVEEEFAFYGIYTVISYTVHEISAVIPYLCLAATFIWLAATIKSTVKSDFKNKKDLIFGLVLVVVMGLSLGYVINQANYTSTTLTSATVESVNTEDNTITVKTQALYDDCDSTIVLEAPDLFINIVETNGQKYILTYQHKTNDCEKGRLSTLKITEE